MIWKAMLEDPFLLHTIRYEQAGKHPITALHAISLRPSYLENTCWSLHTELAHEPHSNASPINRPVSSAIGALSWLRTCRLIYNEAKPLLENNLSLYVCDNVTLSDALSGRTSPIPRSQIQALELCGKFR